MQTIGLFFFVFLFLSPAWAQKACQEKNHIFLIHGVAGSQDTFGYLKDYLQQESPCFAVYPFEYATGHPSQNTFDFAQDFHHFVEQNLQRNKLRPQDKISLVMHSQGGLVGSLWLRSLKESKHPFGEQLDAFITLSTPYWGAPIADLGKKIFYSGLDENPISPFGKSELNEMSFGSHTISKIYQDFEDIFTFPKLRPLAIGGLKKLSSVVTGEDDLVVPIYSSRPDHYRASLTQSASRGPAAIRSRHFEKTNFFRFVTVKSEHFNFGLPGIASIPFRCLFKLHCQHPSLESIVKHLKGEEVGESNGLFHRFRVQIFLENETRNILSFKDAKLTLLDRDGTWIPRYQALLKYRGPASNKEGKAFTFSGVYLKEGPRTIKVKVSLQNRFERVLDIPVEGGHTSLIHLHLND